MQEYIYITGIIIFIYIYIYIYIEREREIINVIIINHRIIGARAGALRESPVHAPCLFGKSLSSSSSSEGGG